MIVPKREPEHASQFLHAIRTHVFVKMNYDFGISVRVEMMPAPFEFPPEFREIIDFAVEDNPSRAIFVEHRLMTAGKINNAQPAHTQAGVLTREQAFVVGTTVHDGLAHLVDQSFFDPLRPI